MVSFFIFKPLTDWNVLASQVGFVREPTAKVNDRGE